MTRRRSQPIRRLSVVAVLVLLLGGCDGPPPAIGELRGVADPGSQEITALVYSPDGRTLASRAALLISFWDADTLWPLTSAPSDSLLRGGLAFSPDGRFVAAPSERHGAALYEVGTGQQVRTLPDPPPLINPATPEPQFGAGVAFSPDGSTVAGPGVGFEAPSVALFDRESGKQVGLGPPGTPMTQVVFTADGRTLVAKGIEGTIRTWDVAGRREGRTIPASASYLTGLAVSPDGKVAATSGTDRYLRLYRLDDGAEVGKFKGHLKAILGIAYHPSGRYIATGDAGGTIFLWDVTTGRVVAQFAGPEGKVWALAFRPDGHELAAAGQDRRLRIYSVDQALKAARR